MSPEKTEEHMASPTPSPNSDPDGARLYRRLHGANPPKQPEPVRKDRVTIFKMTRQQVRQTARVQAKDEARQKNAR